MRYWFDIYNTDTRRIIGSIDVQAEDYEEATLKCGKAGVEEFPNQNIFWHLRGSR